MGLDPRKVPAYSRNSAYSQQSAHFQYSAYSQHWAQHSSMAARDVPQRHPRHTVRLRESPPQNSGATALSSWLNSMDLRQRVVVEKLAPRQPAHLIERMARLTSTPIASKLITSKLFASKLARSVPLIVATLSSLALVGCSDEENPLAGVSGFCSAWADRACSDEMVTNCASTDERCTEAQQEACEAMIPSSKYNASAAEDCLAAVRDAYVDGDLNAEEIEVVFNLGGDCELILSGDGVEGDDCEENSDCDRTQDYECVIATGETEGTCAIAEVVEAGRSCGEANQVCEEGFYCNGDNCVELPTDGMCSDELPCGAESRCVLADEDDDSGICEPRLATGDEGCEVSEDCLSNICEIGDSLSVCTSVLRFQATSELCEDFR